MEIGGIHRQGRNTTAGSRCVAEERGDDAANAFKLAPERNPCRRYIDAWFGTSLSMPTGRWAGGPSVVEGPKQNYRMNLRDERTSIHGVDVFTWEGFR